MKLHELERATDWHTGAETCIRLIRLLVLQGVTNAEPMLSCLGSINVAAQTEVKGAHVDRERGNAVSRPHLRVLRVVHVARVQRTGDRINLRAII